MSKERTHQSIFDAAGDGLIVHDLETGRVVDANPAAGAMHGYAREALIGLHATTLIHPDSQPLFGEYVQVVQSGGVLQAQMVQMRRDGSAFYAEWRGTAFSHQGRPCLLSVVRDVSERVQAERQLQQHVAARTREQAALLEISQTLASALELQPNLILDQLRAIMRRRGCTLGPRILHHHVTTAPESGDQGVNG